MASSSSVSEKELNLTADNVEIPLIENNENLHVNEWIQRTVREEIARGFKLREEVKRTSPQVHKSYHVVDVNYKRSRYSELPDKSSHQRLRTRGIQDSSCPPCRSRISSSSSSRSSRSRSKAKRCPLRIAELAVPSKRYCIATWRDKAETLPISMVDRLKKYVMDESAVVQVSDAITCFQRKRKTPKSCQKKKLSKYRPKVCLAALKKRQDMMEIRNLCAIFGHKLAKNLIMPINIALDSDWQRLSDIVSEEIANLMKGKTMFHCDDSHYNKGIREEISNKVALWIASVLEDTSYKLLEKDLRVRKNKERRSGQDENLVTVIENHLPSRHRDGSDLEEEEGPALDFIDDLVNNVMNVCLPSSDTESGSDGKSDIWLSNEGSAADICNDDQITGQSNGSKGGSITEIVNELINDIIAPEFPDDVNTEPILDLESDTLTDEEELRDAKMNNNKLNPVQNSIALEGARDDINLFNPDNNQDDTKVSEVLTGEEHLDDKNKKVKFTDLAARGVLTEHSIENSIDNNSKSNLIPNLSWVMTFSDKPDIIIAPPNEYLLSDADESWPEDITTPMLKVSESVSKSVTSLGRIIESEEKVSNLQDEDNMKEQAEIVQGLVEQRIKTIEPDHHTDNATDHRIPIDKSGDDTTSISMKNIGKSNVAVISSIKVEVSDQATNTADLNVKDETTSYTGSLTDHDDDKCTEPLKINYEIKVVVNKIKSKLMTENEITSTDGKKGEIKHTTPNAAITSRKLITDEALLKDVGKGDHNGNVDSEKDLILEAVQQIIKQPYMETKIDYRVDPRTAPAWVVHNQTSEDSLLEFSKINKPLKLKESKVRKWIKDLEQSFINLEQWNNWVDNTCRQIMFYKQRQDVNKVFPPHAKRDEGKHWEKLNRTVNRDAVLWTKLSICTQEILQKYRTEQKSTTRLNEEVYEIMLNRKHTSAGSILKVLDEIDRNSLWMHRLIVSTEYCVKCNCKTFSRN